MLLPSVGQEFSDELAIFVACGVIDWVPVVCIGRDEVATVLRFGVGAGVVGAEAGTQGDVGRLVTSGGAKSNT